MPIAKAVVHGIFTRWERDENDERFTPSDLTRLMSRQSQNVPFLQSRNVPW